MHGYEEDLEEDSRYDSYYSDDDVGIEQDEYEEEEEEVKPTKEEQKFLEFRQQLKDSARKKMQKGGSNAQSSQEKRKKLPYNDFGSFFGPSKPVISSRVIQESKSLLENEHLASKILNSNQAKKRPVSTSGSGTKNEPPQERRPKVVNEVRRKVQALKDTRDYSFLLSDDADLPVSNKESLSRNGSIHKSEPRSAQLSARPKQSSGIINGRTANGHREEKRPVSSNGQMNSRLAPSGGQMQQSSRSQINQSRPSSSGNQMQQRPASSAGRPASSGSQMLNSRPAPASSGRPASSGSQMQSRPASSGRPASSSNQMQQRATASGSQRPGSSANRAPLRAGSTMNSQTSQSANRNGQPNSRLDSQRSAPPAKKPVTMDHRRQLGSSSSNGGVGPGRPATTSRPLPSKTPISSLERKASISGSKTSLQNGQRPSSSRPLSSDPRQRMEQRKLSQDRTMSRMIPKQSAPTSKHHQMSQSGPKRPAPRESLDDRRPKKKRPNLSEDDMAFSMIRQMFKTDRFAGRDEGSDSDMEANFEDIMREEKRSARIAREEDEEQLRLIEEEEKRERLRLEKKRKLSR